MKLNPRKCKEMLFNFMLNPNIVKNPIFIGDQEIERVSTYKLLGVVLSDDLKWNNHIDYIVLKGSKCLYGLRLMKWAGAKPSVILIRVLLDQFLNMQCKCGKTYQDICIIYPDCTYNEALLLTKESLLADRRRTCRKLMSEMCTVNEHPLSFLRSKLEERTVRYNLRSGQYHYERKIWKAKWTESFFTFKYEMDCN
ncbi:Hypothetical predicted protein [Paramuricea clavata]|uniref:Uncharacterized protein n=1 Tax=Paramuricea clavata TaxID=317549 RepID=A0A7D9E5B2_PARCT|nr:Hypothetical predicted protein [Paramuricea clavata]